MKKIIFLVVFVLTVCFVNAQEMNFISNKIAKVLPNGWHKFKDAGVVYDVEVNDGWFVKGNVVWFDRSSYSGSLGSKGISGKGTYKWPNGDRYEGTSKNNARHGKGTMYWKNGTKFIGKWKNNKQHGKGKLFDAEGNIVKAGVWENGEFTAKKK